MTAINGKPVDMLDMGEVNGHLGRLATKRRRLLGELEVAEKEAAVRTNTLRAETTKQVSKIDADLKELEGRKATLIAEGNPE